MCCAIAGSCRGGPFLTLPEVPPGVRPSFPGCQRGRRFQPPASRFEPLESNRYTNLLETGVTQRKQRSEVLLIDTNHAFFQLGDLCVSAVRRWRFFPPRTSGMRISNRVQNY